MSGRQQLIALEAKSPFELRVDLGKGVPESDVRTALATGEMGFLHSFTTGSTVDGPGVRGIELLVGLGETALQDHRISFIEPICCIS